MIMGSWSGVTGPVLVLVMVTLGAPGPAAAQAFDGEYAFRVLSEAGDSTVVRGRFVLSSTPFDLGALPESVAWPARVRSRWALGLDGFEPTACFGFESRPRAVNGRPFYGGGIVSGFSQWRILGDLVIVPVYQISNAAQHLRVRRTPSGLEGRVIQWTWWGGDSAEWLRVVAERVGEASLDACESILRMADSG